MTSPDEDDEATFADVLNGFTLDSGRGRRKRKKAREPDAEAEPRPDEPGPGAAEPPPAYDPPPGPGFADTAQGTGYFEPARGSGHYEPVPEPGRYQPEQDPAPGSGYFEPARDPGPGTGYFEPAVSAGPARPEPAAIEEETAAVRPYMLTGGRTKANYALELETLVSVKNIVTARMDAGSQMQFEHHQIVEECRSPRSVAEVAALLRVPVGVARVLISDAADAGLLTVHQTVSGSDDAEAHLMLMERVLSGLRRL